MKNLYQLIKLTMLLSVISAMSYAGNPNSKGSGHNARIGPTRPDVQWSGDVTVKVDATHNQRNARVASGPIGWEYVAFTDSSAAGSGYTVRLSRDGGYHWSDLMVVNHAGYTYYDISIGTTDSDTNGVVVFVASVYKNASNQYFTTVDKIDGNLGGIIGTPFTENNSTNPVYHVALATDRYNIATNANPFSVAFAYSKSSATADSLVCLESMDGGVAFANRHVVTSSASVKIRRVDISYAYSQLYANGLYFVAWEEFATAASTEGDIGVSHTNVFANGAFSTPFLLGQTDVTVNNMCRNPSIAVQNNGQLGDSSGLVAVVLFERRRNANDNDVLGYYNSTSSTSNYWTQTNIMNNTSSNAKQPCIRNYYNQFWVSCFDSTTGYLNAYYNNYNINPNIWANNVPEYNDDYTHLQNPYPQIAPNEVSNLSCYTWNWGLNSVNGVTLFDSENSVGVSVDDMSATDFYEMGLYPNPGKEFVNISFKMQQTANVKLVIYNTLGEVVAILADGTVEAGLHQIPFDLSTLNNGLYVCSLTTNDGVQTKRLVVQH